MDRAMSTGRKIKVKGFKLDKSGTRIESDPKRWDVSKQLRKKGAQGALRQEGEAVKAITIWQPWASLVLIGAKPYEFRSWLPPRSLIGQRIAIHAGHRKVVRAETIDLMRRLEAGDPEVNPCLHPGIALPFLKRVLAGLPHRHRKPIGIWLDEGEAADVDRAEPYVCPRSHILCTAVLGTPKRGDECAREFGREGQGLYVPTLAGSAFNWGWPLTGIEPLMPPCEVSGMQGLWEWKGWEARAA